MRSVTAKFSDILDGFEFSTFGDAMELVRALVSMERGSVHLVSSGGEFDEPLPPDIDSGPYLALPDKAELGLGRELAIEFAQERLPEDAAVVLGFFRQRGAYVKFKDLLECRAQLQAWYDFEAAATESRLRAWCAAHGIELF